jgi:isopenicillin-N N-acyltransferase-like protein
MKQTKNSEFPSIEISGNHYEMGYDLGKQISNSICEYLDWIRFKSKETKIESHKRSMLFYNLIKNYSDNYIKEITGISDGANIPFEDAMLCQVRFGNLNNNKNDGCTAFSYKGDSTQNSNLYIGQNQDMESEFLNFGYILKINPTIPIPKIIMFTFPGQIGYAGLNEYGISNFANALYNYQPQTGLPHYILKRKILEQKTLKDCKNILNTISLSEAGNVLISDSNEYIDYEFYNKERYSYETDDNNFLIHTNHYLTNELKKFEDGTLPDSPIRLKRMIELTKNTYGYITIDSLKNMLADHYNYPASICRHGADNMDSISGYIADPKNKTFHVRKGFGCEMNWKSYKFD